MRSRCRGRSCRRTRQGAGTRSSAPAAVPMCACRATSPVRDAARRILWRWSPRAWPMWTTPRRLRKRRYTATVRSSSCPCSSTNSPCATRAFLIAPRRKRRSSACCTVQRCRQRWRSSRRALRMSSTTPWASSHGGWSLWRSSCAVVWGSWAVSMPSCSPWAMRMTR